MNASVSPISQFRSKVQWYLNGNTPNFSAELYADLLVSIKLLSADIAAYSGEHSNITSAFITFVKSQTLKSLREGSGPLDCVIQLRALLDIPSLKMAGRKAFRDSAVQLILVAEGNPDLAFRKVVLDFAKSIS